MLCTTICSTMKLRTIVLQIVGGKNASWYGNVGTSSSTAIGGYEDEYDWADLETDLYHWTKTLRPVQVLLRSGFPLP